MVNCNNLDYIEREINNNKAIAAIDGLTYKTFKGIFQATNQTGFAEAKKANDSWSFPTLVDLDNSLDKWSKAIESYRDLQNPSTPFVQKYANDRIALASAMQGVISEFQTNSITYLNQYTDPTTGTVIGGVFVAVGEILGTFAGINTWITTSSYVGGVLVESTVVATLLPVSVTVGAAVIAGIGLSLIILPAATGYGQKPIFYDGRIANLMLDSQRRMYDAQKRIRQLTKQRDELLANCKFTGICPSKTNEFHSQYFDPTNLSQAIANKKLFRKAVPNDSVDDPRIVAKEQEIAQKENTINSLETDKAKLLEFTQSVSSALMSFQLTRDEIVSCIGAAGTRLDNVGVTKENTDNKTYFKARSNLAAYCAMKTYGDKAKSAINAIATLRPKFNTKELTITANQIVSEAKKIRSDIEDSVRRILSVNDIWLNCDTIGNRCLTLRFDSSTNTFKTVAIPQGWGNFYAVLIGAANNVNATDTITNTPHNKFKGNTLKLLEDLKPGNIDTKIEKLQTEINELSTKIADYQTQNEDGWLQYLRKEVISYFDGIDFAGRWTVTAPSTLAIKNKGGSPFQSKSGFFRNKSNRVYFNVNPETFMLTMRIDNSHIEKALSELASDTKLQIIDQSMVNVDNIYTIEGFTKGGAGYSVQSVVGGSVVQKRIPGILERTLGDALKPINLDVGLSACLRSN